MITQTMLEALEGYEDMHFEELMVALDATVAPRGLLVNLRRHQSQWSCAILAGVSVLVASDYDHATPLAAARKCAKRLIGRFGNGN